MLKSKYGFAWARWQPADLNAFEEILQEAYDRGYDLPTRVLFLDVMLGKDNKYWARG